MSRHSLIREPSIREDSIPRAVDPRGPEARGRWRTIDSANLTSQKLPNGRTAIGYEFRRSATKGTSRFRVTKGATANLLGDMSPAVTVQGKRR